MDVTHRKLEAHAVCWCDEGNPRSRIHRFNSSMKEREREKQIRHLVGASRKML